MKKTTPPRPIRRRLAHHAAAAAVALIATVSALGVTAVEAGNTMSGEPGLTRAEVREALKDARATNRMTPSGEIGDTDDVLAARQAFNELQAEVLLAQRQQAFEALVTDLSRGDAGENGVTIVEE